MSITVYFCVHHRVSTTGCVPPCVYQCVCVCVFVFVSLPAMCLPMCVSTHRTYHRTTLCVCVCVYVHTRNVSTTVCVWTTVSLPGCLRDSHRAVRYKRSTAGLHETSIMVSSPVIFPTTFPRTPHSQPLLSPCSLISHPSYMSPCLSFPSPLSLSLSHSLAVPTSTSRVTFMCTAMIFISPPSRTT